MKKKDKVKPNVSIVTVVYNGEKYIEQAILSVIKQDWSNIEYIIIDGGSTDRTIDIIKKYENKISYWISEPDKGQSDAFIKGFKKCTGDWLTWLNADDILLPGAIEELVTTANKNPEIDCFMGNLIWMTSECEIILCRKGEIWSKLLPYCGILTAYGPSTFFKRKLYDRVDGINRDIHYKMDTDLWWQFYTVGAKFKRLKKYTWALRLHPEAKMSGHNFVDSPLANKNHYSWDVKQKEDGYIRQKYNLSKKNVLLQYFGKITLTFLRLKSFRYLISFWNTKKYYGKNLIEIVKNNN